MPQIICPHCQHPNMIPSGRGFHPQLEQLTCIKCHQMFDVNDLALPEVIPLEYAERDNSTPTMGHGPIALLVGSSVVILVTVLGLLIPGTPNYSRESSKRVVSANNLRQIGLAALMYSNADKEGCFPHDFTTILKTQDITIQIFVSPRTNTTLPTGDDTDRLGDWANKYSDYVWVGAGIRNVAGADTVLAYEKPEGLRDGVQALFADGHVEFVSMPQARAIIAKLKQGKNPP